MATPPLKDSLGKWESQLSGWQRRRIETWIEDSELSRQYYSPIGASRARRIGRRILQRVRHYGAKVRRELANNASAVPERSR